MENRVSKVSVREVLEKYLAHDLALDIMAEIEEKGLEERDNELGMTYGEWKSRFDDDHKTVWAANSLGGFGKAGWSVYGDADDLRIVMIVTGMHGEKVLHLWNDSWGDWTKAKTRYMVVAENDHKFYGDCDYDDFADLGNEAWANGFRDYRIYRYDGTSTDGDRWVLAGRS